MYISPYIGGTCTITSVSITCKNFASIIKPGTLKISTLALFSGSSATLESVTTTDSIGNLIDTSIYSITIKYPTSTQQNLLSYFSVTFTSDNSGTLIANTMSSSIMFICFNVGVAVPKTTILSLILPINQGSVKDFSIGTGTTVRARLLTSATKLTGYTFLTGSLITLTDPIISSNEITISLSGLTTSTTAGYYTYIFLTLDTASQFPTFTLPRTATNTATRYEAVLKFTVNNIIYSGSQVLTILPTSLGATATLLCTDKNTPGLPLTINIIPPISYSLDTGNELVIELEFDSNYPNDLGSGITGAYPT